MHRMGSRGRVAAVTAILVLTAASGAAANDRSGVPTPGATMLHAASIFNEDVTLPFFNAVKDSSAGSITIDLASDFESGQPQFESDLVSAVKAGTLDMGLVGSRALHDAGAGAFDALQAPFVIDSYDREAKVLQSQIIGEMANSLANSGLALVGVLPGNTRYFYSNEKPMVEPADFVGSTVMISRSAITRQVFEALGATVVDQSSPPPVHNATELPLDGVTGNASEAQYLLANVVFEPRPIVILMNETAFANLTEAQRAALQDSVTTATGPMIQRYEGEDAENLASGCRRNLTLVNATDEQRAALSAAVQPVTDQIAKTGPWLGEIQNLLGVRPPNQTVNCEGATVSPSPAGVATPIDGIWRACPTVQEILDAGGDPGEAAGNAGCYTMNFHEGVFREGGSASADSLAGTYSVDGNLLTINRNNGERFVLSWNLLGDKISLGKGPAGSVSPAPLLAVPFERIGD
jgi:TRAP-type C4-dicarboxylate transport system substrate-binding protein